MKKIFLIGGLCCLFPMFDLFGEGALVQDQESDSYDCRESGCDLGGFFCGMGLVRSSVGSEAITEENLYVFNGGLSYHGLGALPSRVDIQSELSGFDGIDVFVSDIRVDAPSTRLLGFKGTAIARNRIADGKSNKVGASFTAGYGCMCLDNSYFGGQVLLDFSGSKQNKSRDRDPKGYGEIKTEARKFSPSAALLFGKYVQPLDALIGIKLGAVLQKSELTSAYGAIKVSKVTPTIGLFIRKGIVGHFSLGLEFDYMLRKKNEGRLQRKVAGHLDNAGGARAQINLDHVSRVSFGSKGYTVRLMGMYKI
ncbi:MAG: hypothetical protein LBJ96_01555 [Holosporaceae bacterium]|jgi:hypothetical protein|nr:hypothetical protein [Holosporaceae bacterium]